MADSERTVVMADAPPRPGADAPPPAHASAFPPAVYPNAPTHPPPPAHASAFPPAVYPNAPTHPPPAHAHGVAVPVTAVEHTAKLSVPPGLLVADPALTPPPPPVAPVAAGAIAGVPPEHIEAPAPVAVAGVPASHADAAPARVYVLSWVMLGLPLGLALLAVAALALGG